MIICKSFAQRNLLHIWYIKYLYYTGSHVHFYIVITTRKAFVVTSMYKSPAHRKYTVAAVGNLSVHIVNRKYYGEFL